MSESPNGKVGNGATVGLSALVAGVAGTLISTLFPKKETRQERAQRQVEQRLAVLEAQTSQAMDRLGKVVDGVNLRYPGDSRKARKRARELGKAASRAAERTAAVTKRQIADLNREASRLQSLERANRLGNEGSLRAKELARTLNDRTTHLLAETRTQLPEWRSRTSRSASSAIGKGSTLAHQALESAPDVREKVAGKTSDVVSHGAETAHQALDRAPAVVDRVQKSLGEAAHEGAKVAAQIREGAEDVIDKASKSSHHAFEQAHDRAPKIEKRVRKLASGASKQAHHVAHEARTQAPEVAASVGSQVATALHDVREGAKPVVDDVTSLASRLVDEAKQVGSHAGDSLLPEVQHRVDDVAGKARAQGAATAATVSAMGATAADRLAHTTGTIEQQSKAAASAAGRGTRDGGAFMLWTVAAAGIVYYAFLDEEQRQKAKEAGQRIVAEIQEVYRDIRGYDEEFS